MPDNESYRIWLVRVLTDTAGYGGQGQDANEPWTPYVVTPGDAAEVRKGSSLANPGSLAWEPLQHKTKVKQALTTTPVEGSGCESAKQSMEKAERSHQFMEKAEQSLLFLTAAGTVCQIGDCEWYGLCVLTLAMLASGDLWV